ncbi:hypothetical protein EJ08DRAFT_166908 [Tothia fuscella]|uniref:Uncharacterized protein n=1 Tax=Tothia fuscella TaxID=1048955 RepID=A0A9P4NUI2_9PEZI|nr:hypothetical protein EJ08DRAFT_166908 [Tothia fuscella]
MWRSSGALDRTTYSQPQGRQYGWGDNQGDFEEAPTLSILQQGDYLISYLDVLTRQGFYKKLNTAIRRKWGPQYDLDSAAGLVVGASLASRQIHDCVTAISAVRTFALGRVSYRVSLRTEGQKGLLLSSWLIANNHRVAVRQVALSDQDETGGGFQQYGSSGEIESDPFKVLPTSGIQWFWSGWSLFYVQHRLHPSRAKLVYGSAV